MSATSPTRVRKIASAPLRADGEFVLAVIRGDLEVNEVKLSNALRCSELRLATEAEAGELGIVPGFASPIGVTGVRVVADDSITMGSNFIAGANKPGFHLRNANYPRDFGVELMLDIARTRQGDSCPQCNGGLLSTRGIEVGHVFKLGTFLSEKLGAFYLAQDGATRPIVMGCYGIGLGRLLAAIVEESHDDKGIVWPLTVSPYQVHLCALHLDDVTVGNAAEAICGELEQHGIDVLFDDRDESAGVKFNDADLLGVPLRLTVSPRTLQKESAELKWRTEKNPRLVPLSQVAAETGTLLAAAPSQARRTTPSS